MERIGTLFKAQIPANTTGTNVQYYIWTSSPTISLSSSNVDFILLMVIITMANFSYTVTSTPKVTVSPVFPSPTDDVTIDFYAAEQTL